MAFLESKVDRLEKRYDLNHLTFKKVIKEALQWAIDIVIAVAVALFITKFIVTHTFIPTGSMIPTIAINDHIMINRLPLYYRDPKPGEIVVFHHEKELIKRVIAVPGDTLDIKDGNVYINGIQLDEPYLNEANSTYAFTMDDEAFPLTMPEDRYFLMGDNRNNSEDSRSFGMISREAIYAKSWFRIWPLNRLGQVK